MTGSTGVSSSLTGKVAVVTGGASGIGAAVVRLLRSRGAVTVVADARPQHGEDPVDVADQSSVDGLAALVREQHRRCDVLVHCAAVVTTGDVLEATDDDWDQILAVNLKGVWRVSRALVPLMAPGSGVVAVSSAAGLRAIPEMAAYVASKAAVVGLTKSMAIDLADRGIRVNCVCPGLVDTPMASRTQELRTDSAATSVAQFRGYLVPRFGEAQELAEAIVLLATNGYTTGATLAVDGGRSLY